MQKMLSWCIMEDLENFEIIEEIEEYQGYKFLVVDLDGTVLTSKNEVSEKTIHTFNQLKQLGVEVVICSGRQRSTCLKVAEYANCGRYIIASNGADVYDRVLDKEIYTENMDKGALIKLKDAIKNKDVKVRILNGNNALVNKDIQDILDETLLEVDMEEYIEENQIQQIEIYTEDKTVYDDIKLEILKIPEIKIVNKNNNLEKYPKYFFDIASQKTSKGMGLMKLCEHLDVSPHYAVAIGDGSNDVPMFEVAGVSIAMGNGSKRCIENANIICDTNDNDGIYKICLNLFDIEEF